MNIIEVLRVKNSVYFHTGGNEVYRLSVPGTSIKAVDRFLIQTDDHGWFHGDDPGVLGKDAVVVLTTPVLVVSGPYATPEDRMTAECIVNAFQNGGLMEIEHFQGNLETVLKGNLSKTAQFGGNTFVFNRYDWAVQFICTELHGVIREGALSLR